MISIDDYLIILFYQWLAGAQIHICIAQVVMVVVVRVSKKNIFL